MDILNIFRLFKKDYKRQIIAILRLKEELLRNKYNITGYVFPEDYKEVDSWTSKFCKTIISQMKGFLKNKVKENIADTNICPWCIVYLQRDDQYIINSVARSCAYSCDGCGYGNRHGNCMHNTDSTYPTVKNLLPVSNIKDIPGLLDGIKKIIGIK